MFSSATEIRLAIGLSFAMVCLVCPIRSCLKARINKNSALDNEKVYKDYVLTFSSHYDTSNPLTHKRGQMRILNMQIAQAKASGNDDTVAALT